MRYYIGIALLCFHVVSVYASTEHFCPAKSMVEKIKFIKAERNADEAHVWNLFSDKFSYEGQMWNVSLLVVLPDQIKTDQDALKTGQTKFKQIKLSTPILDSLMKDKLICHYGSKEGGYIVSAVSPPVAIE